MRFMHEYIYNVIFALLSYKIFMLLLFYIVIKIEFYVRNKLFYVCVYIYIFNILYKHISCSTHNFILLSHWYFILKQLQRNIKKCWSCCIWPASICKILKDFMYFWNQSFCMHDLKIHIDHKYLRKIFMYLNIENLNGKIDTNVE